MNHPEYAADIMMKALLIYLFKPLSPSVFRVTVFVPSCIKMFNIMFLVHDLQLSCEVYLVN